MRTISGYARRRASIGRLPDKTSQTTRPLSLVPRVEASPALAGFTIAFTGALTVAFLQSAHLFWGDSSNYWSIAGTFTRNGHFSLLNFTSPVRGYAMGLITYVLRTFVDGFSWTPSSVVKLFDVTLFALIGSVLAPRVAESIWPERRWSLTRRVVLSALLVVFWSGYLNYPLSDFPGLAVLLLAVAAIAQTDSPAWMLVAGVATALAVDIRPGYLPLVSTLPIIVALTWFHQRHGAHASLARRALCACLLIIGFVGASLPQSLAYHRHYGSWSIVPGSSVHLTGLTLDGGFLLQRYDSFVEPPKRAVPMYYFDLAGIRLLRERFETPVTSVGMYFEVALQHPLAVAGMAARHLVNGLDMRYSTVYVEHIHSGGYLWLRLPGFLLIFLGLVRVLWPSARRSLGTANWRYAVALPLSCVTSLATAIETRYMLPVWILACILVLTPGWPSPIDRRKTGLRKFQTLAILVVAYLGFQALVWHVVSGAVEVA
jgi:hypothetical protein